jgi:hypothetical protein
MNTSSTVSTYGATGISSGVSVRMREQTLTCSNVSADTWRNTRVSSSLTNGLEVVVLTDDRPNDLTSSRYSSVRKVTWKTWVWTQSKQVSWSSDSEWASGPKVAILNIYYTRLYTNISFFQLTRTYVSRLPCIPVITARKHWYVYSYDTYYCERPQEKLIQRHRKCLYSITSYFAPLLFFAFWTVKHRTNLSLYPAKSSVTPKCSAHWKVYRDQSFIILVSVSESGAALHSCS